jgi:hypothetical protein
LDEGRCDVASSTIGGARTDRRDRRPSALDREFLDLATRWNRGTPEAAEYHYDYLLVVAHL